MKTYCPKDQPHGHHYLNLHDSAQIHVFGEDQFTNELVLHLNWLYFLFHRYRISTKKTANGINKYLAKTIHISLRTSVY